MMINQKTMRSRHYYSRSIHPSIVFVLCTYGVFVTLIINKAKSKSLFGTTRHSSKVLPWNRVVYHGIVSKTSPPSSSWVDNDFMIVAATTTSKQAVLLGTRGGGNLDTSPTSSLWMDKVRNMLRSALRICERQVSPDLAKFLRLIVRAVESTTGATLLNDKDSNNLAISVEEKTKKKLSKRKSRPSPTSPKEEEGVTTTTTTTTTPTQSNKNRKKKKQTNESSNTRKQSINVENETSSSDQTTSVVKSKPGGPTSTASQSHLSTKLSKTNPNYRIQRELKEFLRDPPPNLSVQVGKNIRIWIVTMQGVGIYQGEVFRLRIQFPPRYPMVPPSVYFLPKIPVHEHVYTNGDICLSLLGDGWRPTMTAQSIAVSILSILASAQSKSLPMDNARHAHNKPGQYQKDWVYHDDNC